jgi:hypothetical protein
MKEEDKTITLENPELCEEYTTRPNRKPDVANKGRMVGWLPEGVFQFAARVSRPELQQEVLVKKKDLKVAKTRGEKESTIILTAKVDGNATDPYGALLDIVQSEIASKAKGEHKLMPTSRMLLEKECLKVWQKKREKKVCVYLELDTNQDKAFIYRDFTQHQTQIYKLIDSTKF